MPQLSFLYEIFLIRLLVYSETPSLKKLFVLNFIRYPLKHTHPHPQAQSHKESFWERTWGASQCPWPWEHYSSAQHTANTRTADKCNTIMVFVWRCAETVPITWVIGTSLPLPSENETQHGFTCFLNQNCTVYMYTCIKHQTMFSSPFLSVYLNFSVTKHQIQILTRDMTSSSGKHCGSTWEELASQAPGGTDPTRRSYLCMYSTRT